MLTIDTFLWCYLRHSYTFSVLFWVDLLSVVCAVLEVRWLLSFILTVFDTLLPSSVLDRGQLNRMNVRGSRSQTPDPGEERNP